MKKSSKNKVDHPQEKPLPDEGLNAIMDERVRGELKKFIKNPPPPITKEQEDGVHRRNEDGWVED